jgi:hypothetical protein
MTEDDIKQAQTMINNQVDIINQMSKLNRRLKSVVVDHQKFIVDHITGAK